MFDRLNAAMQRFDSVGCHDRDWLLSDDRSVIYVFIHEVDGYARRFDTVGQCLFDGPSTGESREQSRMNVHDRIRKTSHGLLRKNPHEPCEDHEFNLVRIQQIADRRGKRFPIRRIGPVDHLGGDPGSRGSKQAAGAGTVRNHKNRLGRKVRVVGPGIQNGLQV